MTDSLRDRLFAIWRRVLSLSWPVMAEQVLRTMMRTTDIIVTGLFSPAAVAAIGLADLYARLPLRIGLGLGGGAIALSSQDTGSDATANRDEAVTQAILIGAISGIPFVLFGLFLGEAAISILGAPPEVARMGGTYLAVIFATAPARHVALVGARSLHGRHPHPDVHQRRLEPDQHRRHRRARPRHRPVSATPHRRRRNRHRVR